MLLFKHPSLLGGSGSSSSILHQFQHPTPVPALGGRCWVNWGPALLLTMAIGTSCCGDGCCWPSQQAGGANRPNWVLREGRWTLAKQWGPECPHGSECCIPPTLLVSAGFALKQTPKTHRTSPHRCPWGEQLLRSVVFFVNTLQCICKIRSWGKKASSYIHITIGTMGS